MTIQPASDHSLLVSFGDEICEAARLQVLRLTLALRDPRIRNLHPAYTSVLVSFDPLRVTHAEIEALVRAAGDADLELPPPRTAEIPVCYDGPDLPDVAAHNGLTPDEVVEIHSSAGYIVYFLGFAPGFPYLGGMSERIATPRLPSPRKSVPAGSVAIGGRQTGIYSVESPGGWRIIGSTPLRLYTPEADPPVLLRMGDRVRFVPIS